MTAAALGTTLTLETLDGDGDDRHPARHPVRAGHHRCAAGACRTCAAPAAATCSSTSRSQTPTKLDAEQEELLRELAELRGEEHADISVTTADERRRSLLPAARRVQVDVTTQRSRCSSSTPRCWPLAGSCLDGAEGRHAADVRRLRVGEALILVGDGRGGSADGVVAAVARGSIEVDVSRPAHRGRARARGSSSCRRSPRATAASVAVEAMTEVGVDEIVRWPAARSVAKWTDRTQPAGGRTARAAAKQARRAWVPERRRPGHDDGAGASAAAGCGARPSCCTRRRPTPLVACALPDAGEIVLVVGPEGGITPDELAASAAAGAVAVPARAEVLRTSTAGVAALSVLAPPVAGAS